MPGAELDVDKHSKVRAYALPIAGVVLGLGLGIDTLVQTLDRADTPPAVYIRVVQYDSVGGRVDYTWKFLRASDYAHAADAGMVPPLLGDFNADRTAPSSTPSATTAP